MAFGILAPGNTSPPHARLVSVRVYPKSAGSHRVAVPMKGFTCDVSLSFAALLSVISSKARIVIVFFLILNRYKKGGIRKNLFASYIIVVLKKIKSIL